MVLERVEVQNMLARRAPLRVTPELAEVIENLQRRKRVSWSNTQLSTIGGIMVLAGHELKVPPSFLVSPDFKQTLDIFEGNTLASLYGYARYHPERIYQGRVNFLLERAGIRVNPDDMIVCISSARKIVWDRVNPEAIRGVLERAAQELGRPIALLDQRSFRQPLDLVGGRNLAAIYQFAQTHPLRQGKDTILFLLEQIGTSVTTEDVITQMQAGRSVYWNRIPPEEVKRLLERVAAELDVPALMLYASELLRMPVKLLGGHTLGGLYNYISNEAKGNEKKISTFTLIIERVGIRGATVENVIAQMTKDREVFWERVSWEEITKLIYLVAKETGLPVYIVRGLELSQPLAFLNNHSLGGLKNYCLRHPEKDKTESAVAFLRRKCGLPSPLVPLTREGFRRQQFQKNINALLEKYESLEHVSIEELTTWINDVARIYRTPALGIEIEDLQSEIAVYLAQRSQDGTLSLEKINDLHQRLEQIIREASYQKYKELSLATKIGNTLTLGDVIRDKGPDPSAAAEEVEIKLLENWEELSSLQQQLVLAVAVGGKTFEELSEELKMDPDTLQEYYDDALVLLGKALGTNSGELG